MFLVNNEVHAMDLAAMEDEIEMENDHENQPLVHDLRPTSRALQHVSTVAARKTIIVWMIEDEALYNVQSLPVRTIRAFPEQFRGQKSANYMKATRWWKLRDQFFNDLGQQNINVTLSCNRSRLGQRKQLFTKAGVGHGQKRSEWVQWLYPRLLLIEKICHSWIQ